MNKAFTLTEMLIVISIIGTLSVAGIGSYSNVMRRSRDVKRIADMKVIYAALEEYKLDNNDLPNETCTSCTSGGWEVSTDQNFMEYLRPYIRSTIADPSNKLYIPVNMFLPTRPSDGNFLYMYHYYNWPSPQNPGAYYGCNFDGPFAIFGLRALESATNKDNLPKARCGPMPCAGGGIPNVCRDWSNEFDYSIIITP